MTEQTVAVIGAYGHTGRFVVAELRRRGLTPILSGRDAGRLHALGAAHPGSEVRPASVDDPASLDRALAGAAAVINCAGPFASTSAAVLEAALRARIPYLDVTAETEAVIDTFAQYADRARDAAIPVVPAMAFFGGLGDLLATVAMGDWAAADRISIAYALSSWKPTHGTRATGQVSAGRRDGRRIRYANHRLEFRTGEAPVTEWTFPEPIGTRAVVAEFTMADSATIPTHLSTREIHTYMSVDAVRDLRDPASPPPEATDAQGRSAQTFLVEVVAHAAGETRRAVARGQDIYAVTAPLVVAAVQRILAVPGGPSGVFAAGELFDARDFLRSLGPDHLTLDLPSVAGPRIDR
ncbi:short subunit dehydrogenase-like uncharacterized protein [Allocatelliglobosispora scoriae]|uniref:Short subunit dehydrogenase-like uncharacterized protein n=1 Tax=Allocatelliglobosispora scoriae TaxID=643052 RepID=A0A841C4T9_9ACTN|nr:saccharopine dehydrogenase NADP-binding domain-containing protein [Allocatelliglobosispora scoriae]MBB5874082.1 short subunit dehydrogenase-like uncharacterized protein [Allocatelliglobosispora scoriae]